MFFKFFRKLKIIYKIKLKCVVRDAGKYDFYVFGKILFFNPCLWISFLDTDFLNVILNLHYYLNKCVQIKSKGYFNAPVQKLILVEDGN